VTFPARVDVVIVGLGPAGAATAIRLARAGVAVLAIDRATFPRDKICSEYMSPETLRQLSLLGVLDRVEAAGGTALRGVTVHGPRGARLTGLFGRAGAAALRPTGLSIARSMLDTTLVNAARAAGAMVIEGAALVGLQDDPGGRGVAGAVFRHDGRMREVGSRLLIGADGLRSHTARLLGGRRFDPLRRYGFVAHVAGVAEMGDTAEMHVGPDGYVGLNVIGGGLTNVAVVVPRRRARLARGGAAAVWHAELEGFPGVRGRVCPDAIARPVLAAGPFGVRSTRVATDGALLVGDAAEFFDPFTGEGICTALRGAALAAEAAVEALASPGPVPAARLSGYRAARRRAFAGKWVVERVIGYGMLAPRLFDRAVERLERRGLADTLVGVTGHLLPPREVLRPGFLAAMMV
jgi:flavin-dependent dehydrogenase